jgi:hypothetical protein
LVGLGNSGVLENGGGESDVLGRVEEETVIF